MHVEKKELPKSQVELTVELSVDEFKPYILAGAAKVSREVKIDGFRPGNVPYEILKKKIGEMTILEEASRIAIDKTIDKVFREHVKGQPVGSPKVDITKIAPGNPLVYKIVIAILPAVTLGEYKDLKVKQKKATVEAEETDRMMNEIREMKVKEVLVDREIKDGDKVLTDINMFLDKVPVEGGQGKGAAVVIGKNYVVPGFDKKILGMKKGETREFSLPYPKDHHMKNLAGKMIEFKAKVNEVYERVLPELNDELAAGFGLKNMEELTTNIKKSLEEQKKREAEQSAEKEMLEKLVGKARFGDMPEVLIEHEANTMLAELEQTVTERGGKFEDYLSSLGKSKEQLTLDLLPEAVKRVKTSLLVREVAEAEKIRVEASEVEKNVEEMKKQYKDHKDLAGRFDTPEYRSYILNVLTSRKVIDKLREWNIVN
ncbi:trigger factor [Candidatus Falkowbacteria bacterium RIFOXYB2_FULL_47_14]|uniref:Trigger factor n=1 Tax=Candidatus Falkowbacteria bacterium RIFOXYA2_FULL_47_19 TaxID=1797994 RepID=A0A1F5SG96_9BACT|nr:MAG: trigger factor [Candidatus Falkowbacteria bacterium RIFOXYA2_FULL_47_19]OGF35562.1 MAG: trigger factor [Candidatus Falkowbacteria bacterium RIFOXYC2_FULL_46_15]OGF42955.1 MAG: trigger factor [Candidatus Falkowbacteria bacterium RIFOXYB2_FULL_47_14]